MASPHKRDPEVLELAKESLRLVVQAEEVLHDLEDHQHKVAAFLQRASQFSDEGDQ